MPDYVSYRAVNSLDMMTLFIQCISFIQKRLHTFLYRLLLYLIILFGDL